MEANLAQQLGWDRLSESTQQQLADGLGEVVFSGIERRCKPLLKRKQRKAYETLVQINPAEALRLLEQRIPDFSAIAEEETVRICHKMADIQAAVLNRLGVDSDG